MQKRAAAAAAAAETELMAVCFLEEIVSVSRPAGPAVGGEEGAVL